MGCSWALYIGWGRLAEALEERCRWQPVEFNGAAVLSLESAPRGRGSGGGVAQDTEAVLDAMAASWTGGGGVASGWRRETKEEGAM
jgi:hypothetical protein